MTHPQDSYHLCLGFKLPELVASSLGFWTFASLLAWPLLFLGAGSASGSTSGSAFGSTLTCSDASAFTTKPPAPLTGSGLLKKNNHGEIFKKTNAEY